MSRFNEGDLVILVARSYAPSAAHHHGDVAKIVTCQEACIDYHKSHYTTLYEIKFVVSGRVLYDVMESALERVDPVSALGKLPSAPK